MSYLYKRMIKQKKAEKTYTIRLHEEQWEFIERYIKDFKEKHGKELNIMDVISLALDNYLLAHYPFQILG